MRTYIFIIILFTYVPVMWGQNAPTMERQMLFEAGTNGYFTYRIASMVTTKEGNLLAFAAARRGRGGDWDPIDIVMRRSTDNGKTWEPLQVVVSGGQFTADNAMPITDYQTGEVHLLYQTNYNKCYYTKSDDEGKTWKTPHEITSFLDPVKDYYDWKVIAPGPGHGIQMTNGRLVVPFWISDGSGGEPKEMENGIVRYPHRPSIVVSAFSDDHGKTWQVGEVAVEDNDTTVIPSETSVIQLADGRVMFNSRNESINYRRLATYSPDGATNWSQPYYMDAFFEPICFGSMVRYSLKPAQSKNRILFCNPDSRMDPWVANRQSTPRSAPNRHRTNLTIRMSYDEGHTWPVSKVLDPEIAGYSDIAVTPDGFIHVLYEGGVIKGEGTNHFKNAHMSVIRFNLEWLTDGQDHLDKKDKPLNGHIR